MSRDNILGQMVLVSMILALCVFSVNFAHALCNALATSYSAGKGMVLTTFLLTVKWNVFNAHERHQNSERTVRVSCLHIIFIKKLTTKYSGTDFKLCETNTIKGTTFWEYKLTETYIGSFWVVWHFVSVAATCPFLPSQQTGACQAPGHLPYQGKHREFLCDRASSVSQSLSSAQ